MVDDLTFKNGMRRLAAGVSIITTKRDGIPYGMACTSVTSVSADPPSLLVCINKSASSHDHVDQAGVFCVNLLSSGNRDLANIFSSSKARELRFRTGAWSEMTTGAPALESAEAAFDCEVVERLEIHTHTIFIGRVVAARLGTDATAPLLYHDGRYSTIAAVA